MIKNINRILRDKRMLISNPLITDNIFVIHDEENVQISRACIIGPKDTPYENGFYFFEFLFPDNYPFEPFKVKFYTNDGKTRMHPNFYSCGKVCVSIIGTWNGPGWTSCQTLSSVLLTFQSLFIKDPLHQEPGYENDFTNKNSNYNQIIHHQNLKIGILQMLEKIPNGFEEFKPLLNEYLIINKDDILEQCDKYLQNDGDKISAPSLWKFSVKLEYENIKNKLQQIIVQIEQNNYIDNKVVDEILDKFGEKNNYKQVSDIISNMNLDFNIQLLLLILQMRDKINVNNGDILVKS